MKSFFQCVCLRSRWLPLPALWPVLPSGSLLHWWLLELCLTTKVLLLLRYHWHVMLHVKLTGGWVFSIQWSDIERNPECNKMCYHYLLPISCGFSATCQARAEAMQRWVDDEEMAAVAVFGLEEEQLKNLCANMEPGGTMVKQSNLLVVFVWTNVWW